MQKRRISTIMEHNCSIYCVDSVIEQENIITEIYELMKEVENDKLRIRQNNAEMTQLKAKVDELLFVTVKFK